MSHDLVFEMLPLLSHICGCNYSSDDIINCRLEMKDCYFDINVK